MHDGSPAPSLKKQFATMRISVKTKIWLTVLTVVLMFSFFVLFYFPAKQEALLLKNYNNEIQNLANTVSLGVKIALKEQNFEGVQTAMDFVKKDPHLQFVSLLQIDTVWNYQRSGYTIKKKIFMTYPDTAKVKVDAGSDETRIIKRSTFNTPMMAGEIMLALNTTEIADNKSQIRQTSLIVSTVVFVVGILMGFLLARNISRPVLKLRDAANRVSEGDLSQRVTGRSRDEIGDLGKAFNKMVEDLSIARKEIEDRSEEIITQRDQLAETINELQETQQQLIQAEKLASLGELTAGIAHEIQNPLNFVNNFAEVSIELLGEMAQELNSGDPAEAIAIANDLTENLKKIHHHGQRADGIVKSMLQHSKSGTGVKELIDINALANEFFKLSYNGLRAKDSSINVVMTTLFDEKLPLLHVSPQDIGRVLVNLYNNAFYAVNQKQRTGIAGFKPEVQVTTRLLSLYAEIEVLDNGIGIPDNIKDKIQQPFFTTKPTGEGTGLGLSLSHDILVKGHGGKIEIDSLENQYTRISIFLPLIG